MRHIAALDSHKASRDAEFNFRTRAAALVHKWQETLTLRSPAEPKAAIYTGPWMEVDAAGDTTPFYDTDC